MIFLIGAEKDAEAAAVQGTEHNSDPPSFPEPYADTGSGVDSLMPSTQAHCGPVRGMGQMNSCLRIRRFCGQRSLDMGGRVPNRVDHT
jgi:hypothetical protein